MLKSNSLRLLPLFVTLALAGELRADPPFFGTIFIDPDIITAADPTTYVNLTYAGRGTRTMFDRRVDGLITVNAFLFKAKYEDSKDLEIRVNPEFKTKAAAMRLARKYCKVIGRTPVCLRQNLKTVSIHNGKKPFGGGSQDLLIHVLQGDEYVSQGILEETMVHELSHVSLDGLYAKSAGWVAAQNSDPEFISQYAMDNPTREDVAESFLPYLALKHRRDRISDELAASIAATIPARIKFFKSKKLDVNPVD